MDNRMYIAIDLKSFYASVECVERFINPLTAKLVVADKSRTSKTICLAVSPALKEYGLSGRSRLFEVEQKAKEIKKTTGKELDYIVAPPRMALYIEYSAWIYSIYTKYISPKDIHVYSIDEVFMDVTEYLKLYDMSAVELARLIMLDVYNTTGITATAGVAPNLYLCKIAMDIRAKHIKADEFGVRVAYLDEKIYREKLWDYQPLTDFWRVGNGIANRLKKSGMMTMRDVALMSLSNEDWLYKMFGKDAEILIDHAWGYEPCTIADIKKYKPKSNSLSSGQVLQKPYEYENAAIVVREMVEQLILDLIDQDLVTDSITMHIGYDRKNVDDNKVTKDIKKNYYGINVPKPAHGTANLGAHTSSQKRIMDDAMKLFDEIIDPELLVRRITITANNVEKKTFEQLDIFTDAQKLEREQKIQKAMLSIKKKYGKNAIVKGTDLQEDATAMDRNRQIGGHKA